MQPQPEEMLSALEELVLEWAQEKGIFNRSTALVQQSKLEEEVEELRAELVAVHDAEPSMSSEKAKLELGDCLIVLTLIASFLGSDLEECYQLAYDKISKRTGKMIDGVFVKDE